MYKAAIFTSVFLAIVITLGGLWGLAQASNIHATVDLYYVDADAIGAATGLSWADAFTNVQDALVLAREGDQIWVAEGIYYPDEGNGQTADAPNSTFNLVSGVALYGGFDPSNNLISFSQRNPKENQTILSGDLQQDDLTDSYGVITNTANITGTNAYHVVYGDGLSDATIFEGFTITAGKATGGSLDDYGGGMYNQNNSNPILRKLFFAGNYAMSDGGGLFNWSSSPTLTDSTFIHNKSQYAGGGMSNHSGLPVLEKIHFIRNSTRYSGGGLSNYSGNMTLNQVIFEENATFGTGGPSNVPRGGGMFNQGSSPILTNIIFIGNSSGDGGGIFNFMGASPVLENVIFTGNSYIAMGNWENCNPTLTNVTFSHNFGNISSGIASIYNSQATLVNTIMWDGPTSASGPQIYFEDTSAPTISYSNIQGCGGTSSWDGSCGTDGGNNIDSDPWFLWNPDPGDSDWLTLEDNDYGDLHLSSNSPSRDSGTDTGCPTTDLDGVPRPIGTFCDMGAYEYGASYIYVPVVMNSELEE